MTHAITALQVALDTARHNEPIHRAEGRTEQADLCRKGIDSLLRAIYNLQGIENNEFISAPSTFVGKISRAINCHSMESGSDTPDFILAEYLRRCLESFDAAMKARTNWYGPQPVPCDPPQEVPVATPQYRMLEPGETIELTDEWLAEGKEWLPRSEVAPGEVYHPDGAGGWHAPHRRLVNS